MSDAFLPPFSSAEASASDFDLQNSYTSSGAATLILSAAFANVLPVMVQNPPEKSSTWHPPYSLNALRSEAQEGIGPSRRTTNLMPTPEGENSCQKPEQNSRNSGSTAFFRYLPLNALSMS